MSASDRAPNAKGLDREADADVNACPDGQRLLYLGTAPGCDAKPICSDGFQDACAKSFCGCDGETHTGCDLVEVPFVDVGPCTD